MISGRMPHGFEAGEAARRYIAVRSLGMAEAARLSFTGQGDETMKVKTNVKAGSYRVRGTSGGFDEEP